MYLCYNNKPQMADFLEKQEKRVDGSHFFCYTAVETKQKYPLLTSRQLGRWGS